MRNNFEKSWEFYDQDSRQAGIGEKVIKQRLNLKDNRDGAWVADGAPFSPHINLMSLFEGNMFASPDSPSNCSNYLSLQANIPLLNEIFT